MAETENCPPIDENDEFEENKVKRPKFTAAVDEELFVKKEIEETTVEEDEADDDSDEEGEGCPICLEAWTTSGFHRICSLKCGHLFGKRCIERWLANATRTKCPQCNLPAKRSDIRVLYTKRLMAMDTTEKDQLLKQLQEEKVSKRMAIEVEARASLALQVATIELERTRQELDRLKRRLLIYNDQEGGEETDRFPKFEFNKYYRLAVQQNACRCLDFDPYYSMFYVSRGLSNSKGHGISKVSLVDGSMEHIHGIHKDSIRYISHSPFKDGLVLTTGNDSSLALTTIASNTVMLSYKLETAGWSCAFDGTDSNKIFAGQANGTIAVFDLRNTIGPVSIEQLEFPRRLPIHTLITPANGKLIGGTLDGPFRFDLKEKAIWSGSTSIKGSCTSVSYDEQTSTIFSSYRMTPASLPAVQTISKLGSKEIVEEFTFSAQSGQSIMGRSTHFSPSPSQLACIVPDEPTSSLHLHSVDLERKESSLISKMETRSPTPILDVKCSLTSENEYVIGALTGTDIYLFAQSNGMQKTL